MPTYNAAANPPCHMIQSIRRSTSDILAASVPARRRACHATTALLVVDDDTAEAKTVTRQKQRLPLYTTFRALGKRSDKSQAPRSKRPDAGTQETSSVTESRFACGT